jgi:membrane protease YdiL (CAAX protease family)
LYAEREGEQRRQALGVVVAAPAGMVVFALLSHRGGLWIVPGALGLLLAAGTIARHLRRVPRPAALLGMDRWPPKPILLCVLGVVIGAGTGALHRVNLGLPLWPVGHLGAFVPFACLIGATEELLYRGWLQGALRPHGWLAAVAIAAVAHAAYKTALFAWPPESMTIDLTPIGLWTTAGGIVFGLLRQLSGSVWPPLLAHAAFDLIVYREAAHAPWWVWG